MSRTASFLLALIVLAIGCRSSSNTSGSSSASGSSPASAGQPIDVCATLPAASAAKLSGTGITKATPRTGLQAQESGCAYGNDDDSLQVEVTVFDHDSKSSYDTFTAATKNATAVSGLGDKAFFDNDGTMYVLAGIHLIQVNGLKTADQCAALARPVLAKL